MRPPMTKISKQGDRIDTYLHVEAKHEHGTCVMECDHIVKFCAWMGWWRVKCSLSRESTIEYDDTSVGTCWETTRWSSRCNLNYAQKPQKVVVLRQIGWKSAIHNIVTKSAQGEIDPTWETCVVKSGSKVTRRNNTITLFARCIPTRRGSIVTLSHFSPRKCVKNDGLNSGVNFEDFSHRWRKSRPDSVFQMQAPTSCDHGCDVSPEGQIRDNVKRFYTICTEIRRCSSSIRNSSKNSDIDIARDIDCRICLRVFSELNTDQHNKERRRRRKIHRAYPLTRKIRNKQFRDWSRCARNWRDLSWFDQCRRQRAWIHGATSCSCLFVRECVYVHLCIKHNILTIWIIYDKTQVRCSQNRLFWNVEKTSQTRAKSNIVKNFVIRNDEKVMRRINSITDVTKRPSPARWRSI